MGSKIFLISLLFAFCHGQDYITQDNHYLPCGVDENYSFDISCVRDFLIEYGGCTAASHSDGEPIHVPITYTYIPKINATVICTDIITKFYGSRIDSFYVNTETENFVLAVDFSAIEFYSPKLVLQLTNFDVLDYAGPLEAEGSVNVTYVPTLTAYGPYEGISPRDVKVSAYSKEPKPVYILGPGIVENKDPKIQQALQEFFADIPTALQELMLTQAYYDFFTFLQNYICDFGYKYNGALNK